MDLIQALLTKKSHASMNTGKDRKILILKMLAILDDLRIAGK